MEEPITIARGKEILACHTTESPLSHYGHAVWSVEDSEPIPGPAVWQQGDTSVDIEIISVTGGWLVVKQPDGMLAGIIWSDGSYFADMIIDTEGHPVRELMEGCQVRGTVPLGELGSILF